MTTTRLHANEAPGPPNGLNNQSLTSILGGVDINHYPDPLSSDLRATYGKWIGLDFNQVICTNGSDELIRSILDAFTVPGDTVLLHQPTFGEYEKMTRLRGCRITAVSTPAPFIIDPEVLIQAAQESSPTVTFVCTPNNPTGYQMPLDDLTRLVDKLPGILVIDEAYIDFADYSQTALPLIQRGNVILMRTLSKAYGMAGLRVGFGLSSQANIAKLMEAKLPYNLSILSQRLATFLLDQLPSQDRPALVDQVQTEKTRLMEALQDISGLTPFPSSGNFILYRSSRRGQVLQACRRANIQIRDFHGLAQLDDCFRITVGTPDQNKAIIQLLKEVHDE